MLIVTAGSHHHPKYKRTIEYCKRECERYGYKCQVYDLGGLGFGTPVSDERMNSKFRTLRYAIKPELVLRSMNETEEEFVVWIDGDATLIGRIDELESDDSFDVGLTVRPKREVKKTAYINAGVLFFKNNAASKKFLQDWITAMGPPPLNTETNPKEYCDQNVLESKLLIPAINIPFWDVIGETYNVCGARVKFLECTQYNNFWSHNGPDRMFHSPDMKIIHFKGRHWASTKNVVFEGEIMDVLAAYSKRFLNG